MQFGQKLLYLACVTALAGCGGGGGSDDGGTAAPGVQQYPAGIYVGTSGQLGGTQRQMIGFIAGGRTGTGGDFYFAKDSGSEGYDALYGTLAVSQATLRSTNGTYFSTASGAFSTNLTVSGTVSGAASADNKVNARISGNHSNPGASGIVPFTLSYSELLSEQPSSLEAIRGTYRTGGFFGGSSVLTIDAQGKVTGNNVGCTLTGTVTPAAASASVSERSLYSIVLTLGGTAAQCAQTGSTQQGVAFLDYDDAGVKSSIWVFTRNQTNATRNTFTLNATADVSVPEIPPATSTQVAEGLFRGTVATAGATGQAATMIVLPDNQYFLYRDVGGGYDVLYGSLSVTPGSSKFDSTNGIYYSSQSAVGSAYSTAVSMTGDVRTRTTLKSTFADPSRAGAVTSVDLAYDATYLERPAALTELAGKTYRMTGGFLGGSMTVTIAATGAITGTSSDNCTVGGSVTPYSSFGDRNLYTASLTFSGERCALLTKPAQNGVAFIDYQFGTGGDPASTLQILTTGFSRTTGERFNTVFVGQLIPTPVVTTPTPTTP